MKPKKIILMEEFKISDPLQRDEALKELLAETYNSLRVYEVEEDSYGE